MPSLEDLVAVFGGAGSSVAGFRGAFTGGHYVHPKRLTPLVRSYDRWCMAHPRGHGWQGPACHEAHCGDRPPHLRTRHSRKRAAQPV